MSYSCDFVIIGAGIVGLALARELKHCYPHSKIIVLEKESSLGRHASGRNSGVLHSGIYYPANSIKAKVCAQGAKEMAQYCHQRHLPIAQIGKVILPITPADDSQLDLLYDRAQSNGVRAEIIDQQQLKTLEPLAYTITGRAIYCPDTSVIDPKAILNDLAAQLEQQGVKILFNQKFTQLDLEEKCLKTPTETLYFGHLFNSAGLYADQVARACNIGKRYTIMPFKGLYYTLAASSGLEINRNIYPVPNLQVPFLGIHFTKKLNGEISLGPTAIPALGRENYSAWEKLSLTETTKMIWQISQQYIHNKQGFRRLIHQETPHLLKPYFAKAAQKLVRSLKPEHLQPSHHVGIRAQLFDQKKQELVMDFIIEQGKNSTHILNAVSPAFTSAFSFARLVLNQNVNI
ncbi:L-2-hydroxyglutarate oxidase [Gloeothece verrucosa]|uniref:FAD dependent oxidoreductase n=1 Tax=Gloeothece verrucosa (strain PCC 7822) TaxID=497965 RepID=E0U5G1_GLOV7|nr:L-2-hydroxyglutarate oxidase [Gloeothece verrucosa]ADN13551.1 FAD dependent oxidoreductase [Gloeothece verrucosa PCC 7822]